MAVVVPFGVQGCGGSVRVSALVLSHLALSASSVRPPLAADGRFFACRHCHNLAYRSQREVDDDRAARRANTIRRRLGWDPGILNVDGWKPKGMHWRTFERLQARHEAFVRVSLAGMARKLGLRRGRLEGIDVAAASWR